MVNEALSAIGGASELSATAQALQQTLLANAAPPETPSNAWEADTSGMTPANDTSPDTPSVLVALASRSQSARRGSGADQPEPTAPRNDASHEMPAAAPSLVAMPTTAPDTPTTLLATPALLTALQTGNTQPLWHGFQAPTPDARHNTQREGHPPSEDERADEEPSDETATPDTPHEPRPTALTTWQEHLAHALKLHAQAAPSQALLRLAAAQWQRGRTVLLVTPRDVAMAERGWLHALRLSATGVVSGERFEARLRWAEPRSNSGAGVRWCGVRATKQQGLHLGRELRVQAELPEADSVVPIGDSASIEVRLGPQDNSAARARVVEVRVDAIARLWACLDAQWSVTVLACDQPLGEATP